MQAVILAGGRGTRLLPLTNTLPKPIIPIHGKPFLQYQIELIKSYGINEVLILVNYLSDQIESHFKDGSYFGLKIEYSYEKYPLGTGGAIKNAEDKLADDFLLMNGDTFIQIDYRDLINVSHKFNKIGIVTVYENFSKLFYNNICINSSKFVLGYNEEESKDMTHVNTGVMVFKKKITDYIPKNQKCSLAVDIFEKLIGKKELIAFTTNQRFYDMGSIKELKIIKDLLKRK